MISRWKANKDKISLAEKTCRRVGKSGRPVAYLQEEKILFDWIIDKRNIRNELVTFEDIRDKMMSLLPDTLGFKASNSWLKGFLSRFNLSNRVVTGTCSNELTEEAKMERIASFRSFIKANPASRIINMDQTPVWLSIGSTGKTENREVIYVFAL